MTEELLTAVKDNIYVTWNEEDESIKKMIAKNAVYLQSKVSTTLSFSPESLEYGLLIERCRYDWNRALDEFEQNFASSLKFRNLSMRDSDITAMDAMGSKLTKKVKTPFHPIAKKFNKDQYFIVINSMRYNVIYADYDNFYIYFYLESVGEYGD